ncbi:MAG: RIP metalloprotease RseP [Opitutaceae bacterium]|nr:RIP metalloprotease RseP [Opitutaceae bacterium]
MSSDLVNSLMANLWSIFLIILFFGGSIFVHEFGHFLAARRRGVKVERFSIGFGPKILAWRGRDGVEYRLSWLPLGGYVALPQLADMRSIEGESTVDTEHLPPVSYSTKLLVFAAGAAMNILFAFLLATVIWIAGQPTLSELTTTRVGLVLPTIALADGTTAPSPASQAGFQPGDLIRSIDGKSIQTWLDLQQTLYSGTGRTVDGRPKAIFQIERDGRPMELTVYPRLAGDEEVRMVGIAPAEDLIVGSVLPGSFAEKAGLLPQDKIVLFDGHRLLSRNAFVEYLEKNATKEIALTVERTGENVPLVLPARPEAPTVDKLGLTRRSSTTLVHINPVRQLVEHVTMSFRVMAGLLSPHSDLGLSKLSGPIGIARGFRALAEVDIRLVLWFTVLVNVNLAIFNLLPIPVLDGGHMLFATIARLRGRALPSNFIAATQSVFIILLFSLIIYVSFFDVRRIVRDMRAEAQTEESVPQPAAPAKP